MIKEFVAKNEELTLQTIRELCKIPAPSFMEEKRAEYCKAWLEKVGATGVYIDEERNVIFPYHCENSKEITVIAAHTDTVFPDTEPYPYKEDETRIYCPGVGDDTTSVAVLLSVVKYFLENQISVEKGVLFVCNSCEEGLGNLVGTRYLMERYAGRIKQFVSLDSRIGVVHSIPVGSHRYNVEVKTQGGHSFSAFGNKSAIEALAQMIVEIHQIQVPQKPNSKTTFNVGIIEGGTSVNTIAQSAKMLCEYRSDDRECLEYMRKEYERIFENARTDEVGVLVEKIGDRPCKGDVDEQAENELLEACKKAIEIATGKAAVDKLASTDSNIPLAMGIPAVTVGVYDGKGEHTREEFIEKAGVKTGLEIALGIALAICK